MKLARWPVPCDHSGLDCGVGGGQRAGPSYHTALPSDIPFVGNHRVEALESRTFPFRDQRTGTRRWWRDRLRARCPDQPDIFSLAGGRIASGACALGFTSRAFVILGRGLKRSDGLLDSYPASPDGCAERREAPLVFGHPLHDTIGRRKSFCLSLRNHAPSLQQQTAPRQGAPSADDFESLAKGAAESERMHLATAPGSASPPHRRAGCPCRTSDPTASHSPCQGSGCTAAPCRPSRRRR